MEPNNIRKDAHGNIISKTDKLHTVSFKEDLVEIIEVESYKEYNILNDKNNYLNQFENNDKEEDEENEENEEDEEDKEKFDINKYNPIKLEKMSNHDPNSFSRAKCVII